MKLNDLQGKKILILGFGIEGKSAYNFLKKHFPTQQIDTADIKTDPNYLAKQKDYDLVIKSPSIHKSSITIPYTTPTNIFFANVIGTTIGITGSKGKSTTSSLVYSILKEAGKHAHLVGNITHKLDNIGKPMLDGLLESNEKEDIWVVELSSYQLDDIAYSPHISVITSFFPEHMDFHKDLESYWSAKANIVANALTQDYLVFNQEDERILNFAKNIPIKTMPFTTLPFNQEETKLVGEHNNANIRAAYTVAKILEISDDVIAKAVKNFVPLPHRLENVGTHKHITFYDDAISTTPESSIAAINTLKNISTIFLGGQDRGYDFTNLAELIVEQKIQNLVLFPESGEKIYNAIQNLTNDLGSSYHPRVLKTTSMEEAVKFAYENSPAGTICLLSTASPSYSIWSNFEEKGNLFKQYVRKLGKE